MIKLKTLLTENKYYHDSKKIKVPEAPVTVSIPSDHIRLFHYTNAPVEVIRKEGLKLSSARGSTYGEPNVIWASTVPPSRYKIFVEFSLSINDERFVLRGAGESLERERGAKYYNESNHHLTMYGDIKPEEFIAVHEPWHFTYRHILSEPIAMQEALDGEFDYLLNDKHSNDARAVIAIKKNFGSG